MLPAYIIPFVVSGGSLVPTVLGPARETCPAYVGGHDQVEAIFCGKAGSFESAAQEGDDMFIVWVARGLAGCLRIEW